MISFRLLWELYISHHLCRKMIIMVIIKKGEGTTSIYCIQQETARVEAWQKSEFSPKVTLFVFYFSLLFFVIPFNRQSLMIFAQINATLNETKLIHFQIYQKVQSQSVDHESNIRRPKQPLEYVTTSITGAFFSKASFVESYSLQIWPIHNSLSK